MSWIKRKCWPGSIVGICDTGRAHRRLGGTTRVVAGGAITAVYEPGPKSLGALIIASKGPLLKSTTAVLPWRQEGVFMCRFLGRLHDAAIHARRRQASEKRQGTKSR